MERDLRDWLWLPLVVAMLAGVAFVVLSEQAKYEAAQAAEDGR